MNSRLSQLPAHWQIRLLSGLAEVRGGVPVNRKASLKDPLLMPFLRTANVHEGYLDLDEIDEMLVERHLLSNYLLRENDVLITAGGDNDKLGRGHLWQGQIAQCMHQNHVYAVRCNPALLLPEFFNLQKSTRYGREYFLRHAKNSTNLSSLSTTNARQFPVILPPLAEQQAICTILRDFDGALAISKKIIANAIQQKQEWARSLFSEQYQLSAQDANWQSQRMEEIAQSLGTGLGADVNPEQEFRYIEIKHVKDGAIADDLPRICKANASSRARNRVEPGAILMSLVRPNLMSFARADAQHTDCIASSGLYVFKAKAQISTDFLYHSLYSDNLRMQYLAFSAGSSYEALRISDVKGLLFRVPTLSEQIAIADILNDFDTRIAIEKRALLVLQQQRMDICEQLLMGEIRL